MSAFESRGRRVRDDLITLLAREVTADPERIDFKRREERRIGFFNEHRDIKARRQRERALEDRRRDHELRKKLNGR